MAKLLGGTTVYGTLSAQTIVYDAVGNSVNWNTAYSMISGGGGNLTNYVPNSTFNTYKTSVVATTATLLPTSIYQSTSSVYTLINTSTATTFNLNNITVNGNLSSNYLFGNTNETVLTDGSNLAGNGNGTITLNYLNGLYVSCSAIPTVDNAYTLGNGTNRWKAIYAANGTIQTSDGRQKTSITPSPLGLEFITSLNPVSYNFIIGSNEIVRDENDNITAVVPVSGKRTHFGLIAQEVKQSIPEGIDFGGWVLTDINDPESIQGLRYEEFISPMIKSIQQLSTTINLLSSQNQELWSIINTLTSK